MAAAAANSRDLERGGVVGESVFIDLSRAELDARGLYGDGPFYGHASRSHAHFRCQNAGVRYVGIILVAAVLYGAYDYVSSRPIDWPAGELVADDPSQATLKDAEPIRREDFELLPRARFSAEVRVLSHERYRAGDLAEISPLDFAVGWGPMSDSAVIEQLDISQANRFYFWHFDDEPPIPQREIIVHSSNWHLVPASDTVWQDLKRVRTGDIITLDGLLIDISNTGGRVIQTSLNRDDTGPGACEVVLVEKISYRYR